MAKRRGARGALEHRADQYSYHVRWEDADQIYVAKVDEFPSLAAHGDTISGALEEIQSVVSDVLEDLAAAGEEIPVPFGKKKFSGKLNLRLPEFLHRQLTIEAAALGISLNQLITLKAEMDVKREGGE